MKKMFQKSELTFAIVLIVIYVVGSSLMQKVSGTLGMRFIAEAVFNLILSAVILVFAKKNHLMKHLGLCKPEVSAAKMLFYIPFALIACTAAFFGIGTEYSIMELIIRTCMMIFVGFLEEVIFRGFLFRGIAKDNIKEAIIISSLTFGLGHIVNLFNGYSIPANVIQIVFAVAAGFMLVFTFIHTGSLIACIVFHAFNNSISAVSTGSILIHALGSEVAAQIVTAVIGIVLCAGYTIYIIKAIPQRELAD